MPPRSIKALLAPINLKSCSIDKTLGYSTVTASESTRNTEYSACYLKLVTRNRIEIRFTQKSTDIFSSDCW